jgi:sugar phosphate isomerase/epimerase
MTYTRREFAGVLGGALAVGPLARVAFAAQASKIAGVRIGTQSYSFRNIRDLDAAIAAIQAAGISYCELWSGHVERVTVPEGGNRREATRRWRIDTPLAHFEEIRKKFAAAGVTLTSYDVPFRADFTDEEMARIFDIGKAFGVNVITSSTQVSLATRLQTFAAKANMAATLDIGHFTAAGFDPLPFLDANHDRIVGMHLKDRTKAGGNLPFGQGETPIRDVLKRLRDRKWDIPAHIEYEYQGTDAIEEVKKSLAFCRQALEAK